MGADLNIITGSDNCCVIISEGEYDRLPTFHDKDVET